MFHTDTDVLTQPAEQSEQDSLYERVKDPKRFVQAAKGLAVLEGDLRLLLKQGGAKSLDAATVSWATSHYQRLRDEVAGLLDDELRAAALDETVGMPPVGDGSSAQLLLMKLSQTTRFLSVEEGWSAFVAQDKLARERMRRELESVGIAPQRPQRGPGTYL